MLMILHQPVNGTFYDTAQRQPFSNGSFAQTILKRIGYAAGKTHLKVRSLIAQDVTPEEITETICHQLVYLRQCYMATDERCQGCQETIGHRLAIDTGNNLCHTKIHILLEFRY